MKNIEQYINSGILELYVLGMTSDEEAQEITLLAQNNSAIKNEIDAITIALEIDATSKAPELSNTIKPLIIATIDYTERLTNGEAPTNPPLLNKDSTVNDYAQWLNRSDMVLPENADDIYAKIIGANEQATTIITWLKYGAPTETHTNEYESFLIVEGTCNITIGETVHSLVAGSYLTIPLHIPHSVKTTSTIPCKVVLQRAAA